MVEARGVDEINNACKTTLFLWSACSPTFCNDNFMLSPPFSKLLSLLLNQHTNIHHHHRCHRHHHQRRPRSQSLLLNPAHYSPSSFFCHSFFIFSIPSSLTHAQAFPIFRTIFLDTHLPLLAILLSFPPSLLNFSQELSVLTASIFLISHSLLNLPQSVFHPHHPLKSFEKVGRTFMFLNLMGTF